MTRDHRFVMQRKHPPKGTSSPSAQPTQGTANWVKLQAKQRDRVARSIHRERGASLADGVHPDLEDLSFGTLGSSSRCVFLYAAPGRSSTVIASSALPPPLRPSAPGTQSDVENERGSLSDFSDYDSSDEDYDAHSPPRAGTNPHRHSEDDDEDPFADPFADQNEVSTPGIKEKKLNW